MSDILNGRIKQCPNWQVTVMVVRTCLEHAERTGRPVPPDLRDEEDWRRRYYDLEQDIDAGARSGREALVGWPLGPIHLPWKYTSRCSSTPRRLTCQRCPCTCRVIMT